MDIEAIIALEERTELPVYDKLPVAPARGRGSFVETADGTRYLDLYGGHAVCLTGHCHPRVVEAIREQAAALLFYSNAVRSEVRARASAALCALAPWEGARVFYVNSGAEANEAAMKLARARTGRRVVLSFLGGFHGRSVGTLSACGMETYRRTLDPLPPIADHRVVAFGDLAAVDAALRDDVALVLLEPIQSMAGVREAPGAFYQGLRELTRARGALLGFDEIQTGLGRTGALFYGEHHGVAPDIITLAKGIASGVPCAAMLCSPEAAEGSRVGVQGTTFGGGPLAMAALEATLQVIAGEDLVENAAARGAELLHGLSGLEGVTGVRGRGLLLGVDLDRPAGPVKTALLSRGMLVGGAGAQTLRLLPPLTLSEEEAASFVEALGAVLEEGRA